MVNASSGQAIPPTEAEIEAFSSQSEFRTWQVRLADTYGDNGLIGVVIGVQKQDGWELDTWLMSCRVLGRRVEEVVLREIVADAAAEGVSILRGIYIPTDRNRMVEKHYSSLGFSKADNWEEAPSNATCWEINVSDYQAPDLPIMVSRG